MQQISLSSVGGGAALAECTWAISHGTGERSGAWALSGTLGRLIHHLGCILIMISFPVIAVYMWYVNEHCDGSPARFIEEVIVGGLDYMVAAAPRPSWHGLSYILVFGAIQAAFQIMLPGKKFLGPPTPKGNVPVYKANGVAAYLSTLVLFAVTWHAGIFNPAGVYDAMGTIVATSNVFSLAFCALLYVKGRLVPCSTDCGSTGSLLFDFYWGRELFPRLGSLDIKTWTNCRMGMMGWAVLPLCYAAKQAELLGGSPSPSMIACVALMQLYVFKFFLWETGYWASMDIAHDRAGFYLVWGCLVWVPSVYTSPAMHLVRRQGVLSPTGAAAVFLIGALMILINYDADRQRQQFRRTGGREKVWGKAPKKIAARYVTGDGHEKESLLLASGWWGLARHFHYVPELAAAAAWSCPSGFGSPLPYVYLAFLAALLTDRAFRDDERCRSKYGKYWEEYCKVVPYRIVPYVF